MTAVSYLHFSADKAPEKAAARSTLRIWGQDAERFLQGILSQDATRLGDHQALACCVLNVKGKLQWEAVAWRDDDSTFFLSTPTDGVADLKAELERHVIMDDVEMDLDPLHTALLFNAAEIERHFTAQLSLQTSAETPGEELVPHTQPDHGEAQHLVPDLRAAGIKVLDVRHPAPGLLIVGTAEQLQLALAALAPANLEHWERIRVMTASPAWQHELVTGNFPPECGFVHAVSYDKGCYMGQEPLARIHARSQVNWVLVLVEITPDPDSRPDSPATVGRLDGPVPLRSDDRDNAGRLTTLAKIGEQRFGLAIVRRPEAVPGTRLRGAASAAGEGDGEGEGEGDVAQSTNSSSPQWPHLVVVRSGPLGDDQGIAARARGER